MMTQPSIPNDHNSSENEQFIALVENLAVGVVKHLPDSSIVLANNKALELLGLTKDQ
jgi:PAS domain-containing protein